MPSDVTGASIYRQPTATFVFRPGPVFTNLLLADEINRAPPKTQSALLEAMAERQVTIEGETYQLPPPFLVLATQNPIEYEGTYPLPEAQLDRFLMRIAIGYPGRGRVGDPRTAHPAGRRRGPARGGLSRRELIAMQGRWRRCSSRSVGRYMVDLVDATRASPRCRSAPARAGRSRC